MRARWLGPTGRVTLVCAGLLLTHCARLRADGSEAPGPSAPIVSAAVASSPPIRASATASAVAAPPPPPALAEDAGPRAVRGPGGAVVSVEAHATRAGVRMLERGGNAVDAAVAVAYALAVTHPSAGNVGGGGFMLVRFPGQDTVAVDFRETAPAALDAARYRDLVQPLGTGPATVGVPGTVAGLALVHERFGKLPRAVVMNPAIELARNGFALGTRQSLVLGWSWPALSKDIAARAAFGGTRGPKRTGDRLRQPDLARALERIAEHGAAGFYRGPTADAIVTRLSRGGLLTRQDLESYRAMVRVPLEFRYRGLSVQTMPPPSAGGVALAQMLIGLDRLRAYETAPGSVADLHLFLEASRRAQTTRRFEVIDPDALSKVESGRRLARWTDPSELWRDLPAIDPVQATPSRALVTRFSAAFPESEHTTHFSVADRDGAVVSCTVTLSGSYGARLVVPGTGIVLNNAVGSFSLIGDNMPVGGRRTTSSMAPTLVLSEGEPLFVLGTPGGDSIPSTLARLVSLLVDRSMTLSDAVDAPRLHHRFAPDEIRFERAGPPPTVLADLLKLGHRIEKRRTTMGDANVIGFFGGVAHACADRREGGLALAARPPSVVSPVASSVLPLASATTPVAAPPPR